MRCGRPARCARRPAPTARQCRRRRASLSPACVRPTRRRARRSTSSKPPRSIRSTPRTPKAAPSLKAWAQRSARSARPKGPITPPSTATSRLAPKTAFGTATCRSGGRRHRPRPPRRWPPATMNVWSAVLVRGHARSAATAARPTDAWWSTVPVIAARRSTARLPAWCRRWSRAATRRWPKLLLRVANCWARSAVLWRSRWRSSTRRKPPSAREPTTPPTCSSCCRSRWRTSRPPRSRPWWPARSSRRAARWPACSRPATAASPPTRCCWTAPCRRSSSGWQARWTGSTAACRAAR